MTGRHKKRHHGSRGQQRNQPISDDEKLAKLRKEQQKQRKRRLIQDNIEEDKNLRRLEKQLKLNKRKNKKTLPKSFVDDGLDFLLEVCDGNNLQIETSPEDAGEGNEELPDDDSDDGGREPEKSLPDDASDDGGGDPEHLLPSDASDDGDGEPENNLPALPAPSSASKYVPPGLRAKMTGLGDEKRREALNRLKTKLKGCLNRLATSNMGVICRQVEQLYEKHSRNDMNESLWNILRDSLLLSSVRTPERLIMEHAMLVAVLNVNIGVEVGASIVQSTVKLFDQHYREAQPNNEDFVDRKCDNVLLFVCYLYAFKVIGAVIVFDLLHVFTTSFSDRDIELILSLLKTVGFNLRKDDPSRLKSAIVRVQQKSQQEPRDAATNSGSRVKFMLDVLMAIKNNNVKKIPNYDTEHQQLMLKSMKQWTRPGRASNELNVSYDDLLQADSKGRWWLVGSAWAGPSEQDQVSKAVSTNKAGVAATKHFSQALLDLAKGMRMNTDARKDIFCSVMSAEDCVDAFERLVKLPIKANKQREIAFVLLDCCMQERTFNPFYCALVGKLAISDRKYRMAAQFSLWDKIKVIPSLKPFQLKNLARFTSAVIADGVLSVTCLKVIEFADLNKHYVAFLRQVLTLLLANSSNEGIVKMFQPLSDNPRLKLLRESLRLFMHQFMLKKKDGENDPENSTLDRKITIAEEALTSSVI